jgi:sterol desaturase/sphingolipid hydroxylase (fatty acid hydroxylase superfamily)
MTAREFLINLSIILGIMAIGALLETVVPMFAAKAWKGDRRGANLALTAVVFLFNWLLTSIAALVALTLSLKPAGVTASLGLPFWAQIVSSVVILDFSAGYVSHRGLHMVPALWRVHRIHHSDPFVDVTTTYRTHPVETLWRFLFVLVPVWTLGIPAQAVLIQRLLQAGNGILEHANVRLWAPLDRLLSQFWVTPNVHKIHHSRARAETNSNYGNVLSLYDRLLGTFTPAERAHSVVYGLDDADPRRLGSFTGLLAMPLHEPRSEREEQAAFLTQNSGTGRA